MSDKLFAPIIATWVVVQFIFLASVGPIVSIAPTLA